MERDYYHILQVAPQASFEVIKSAYRALLKDGAMHPDLGGNPKVAQALNEAYQVLSDPATRSEYDAMLKKAARIPNMPPNRPKRNPNQLLCPHCKAPNAIESWDHAPKQRCHACKRRLLPVFKTEGSEVKSAHRLGIFLFEKGMVERALREFEMAVHLRPKSDTLHYWKGRCLYSRHLFKKAKFSFSAAAQLQPAKFHYHFWLGQACFAIHHKHEAILAFQKALTKRPHHAGTMLRLANCHYELGNGDKAKALLQKGLMRHPDQIQMYVLLGFILIRQDDHANALKVFSRLQQLFPRHALAQKYTTLLSSSSQKAEEIPHH